MRILFVEDELHLAEALSQLLKKEITQSIWSMTARMVWTMV